MHRPGPVMPGRGADILDNVMGIDGFTARTALAKPVATVSVSGEVDVACAEDFESTILLALTEPGMDTVAVHLGGVVFMDASALGALVRASNTALALNSHLILEAVPQSVQRLLDLTGLDGVFCSTEVPCAQEPACPHHSD